MVKDAKGSPVGIAILRVFYLLNALLCAATVLIFYKAVGVMVLGLTMPKIPEIVAKLVFIAFPLYIYLDLKIPNPRVFFTIQIYHCFFIINNVSAISYILWKTPVIIAPLVQMVSKDVWIIGAPGSMGYTTIHLVIHCLGLLIGLAILFYISRVRNTFFQKGR